MFGCAADRLCLDDFVPFSCAFDVLLFHRRGGLCVVSCQYIVALSARRVLVFGFGILVLVDFEQLVLLDGVIILPTCVRLFVAAFNRCVCVCLNISIRLFVLIASL